MCLRTVQTNRHATRTEDATRSESAHIEADKNLGSRYPRLNAENDEDHEPPEKPVHAN